MRTTTNAQISFKLPFYSKSNLLNCRLFSFHSGTCVFSSPHHVFAPCWSPRVSYAIYHCCIWIRWSNLHSKIHQMLSNMYLVDCALCDDLVTYWFSELKIKGRGHIMSITLEIIQRRIKVKSGIRVATHTEPKSGDILSNNMIPYK